MARSDTRERILASIQDYIADHGYGPSVRELCQAAGLSSTATVVYHLRQLAAAGLIGYDEGKKRSITLPGQEGGAARVPVLGAVAAGQPILAQENVEGWLPWPGGEGWFALRVKGESMKNAGILPGDRVVVRPQPTAEQGEIVVALLGDEATVKRLDLRTGHILLLPENEAFDPIDGTDARILGVVRGVVRTYD